MESLLPSFSNYLEFVRSNWVDLAIYTGIMCVCLWSASYSASIGEIRLRRPWIHFLFGLFIPVIYPAIALFKLPTFKAVSRTGEKEQEYETGEGPPPVEIAAPIFESAAPTVVNPEMLEKTHVAFDQNYFKKIAIDVAGNYRGPFLLTINDEKLKAERIIDPLPNVLLVEFISADGKLQNIRIPYKNIEACVEL